MKEKSIYELNVHVNRMIVTDKFKLHILRLFMLFSQIKKTPTTPTTIIITSTNGLNKFPTPLG